MSLSIKSGYETLEEFSLGYRWSVEKQRWVPIVSRKDKVGKLSHQQNANNSADLDRLSVLTYNIWFDKFERDLRLAALLQLIQKASPTIVCLQEGRLNVLHPSYSK